MAKPPKSVILDAKEYWSTDPSVPYLIRMKSEGPAAEAPVSIMAALHSNAVEFPNHPALVFDNLFQLGMTITYSEYEKKVIHLAKAFIKIGLEPRHSVAVLSETCPEWYCAALATIYADGIVAGVYTTNFPEAVHHVLDTSRANVIIVDTVGQLQKVKEIRDKLPLLKAIVQIEIPFDPKLTAQDGYYRWNDLERMDVSDVEEEFRERQDNIGVNQAAVLVFTSGTVGKPKGVILSQDNLMWNAKGHLRGQAAITKAKEVFLSYFPLNHIAGHLEIYYSLVSAGTVYFADKNVFKGSSVINSLLASRPTRLLTIPRICEKIHERINAILRSSPGNDRMCKWAKGVATDHHLANSGGFVKKKWMYGVAQALFLTKLKAAIGLDRCVGAICGAAPASAELKKYFLGMDLPLLDAYGLSESTGAHTMSQLGALTVNSVGKTLAGCETRINNPDDKGEGEICLKGRNIFMGYIADVAMTRETIDEKGWLHTGDLGRLDDEGFLYITGRLKELIVTSGGENIAPVPIEQFVKGELPCVSNAVLIGDQRKFLSILITLKTEVDMKTSAPKDELREEAIAWMESLGLKYRTIGEVVRTGSGICPVVQRAIEEGITRANQFATSRAHKVQKFILLDRDLSLATGELGPTLKLKRNVIAEMYKELIDKLYE